jgi:hypothetical protein
MESPPFKITHFSKFNIYAGMPPMLYKINIMVSSGKGTLCLSSKDHCMARQYHFFEIQKIVHVPWPT